MTIDLTEVALIPEKVTPLSLSLCKYIYIYMLCILCDMCIYEYSIRKDHPRILIVSVAEKDHTCLNRQGSSCWSHVQGMPPYLQNASPQWRLWMSLNVLRSDIWHIAIVDLSCCDCWMQLLSFRSKAALIECNLRNQAVLWLLHVSSRLVHKNGKKRQWLLKITSTQHTLPWKQVEMQWIIKFL